MEIKRTLSRIAYRIEQKPDGGFIARCSDPTVPPLEAASRFELEQQIQAKITAEMETQIPGLKIRLTLGTKPEGSVFAQSGNSSPLPTEGGTKNSVGHWLADKAVSLVEKNLPPELIDQLKHQSVAGKINVTVTQVGAEGKVRRDYVVSGNDILARFKRPQKTSGALEPSAPVSASFSDANLNGAAPITPGNNSSFLRFLIAAMVLAGILIFFLYLKK